MRYFTNNMNKISNKLISLLVRSDTYVQLTKFRFRQPNIIFQLIIFIFRMFMVKDATFYMLITQISILFPADLQVQMMIDVGTFYLDETTTIQCSASKYTERLELRTSIGGEVKGTGCTYGGGEWTAGNDIFDPSVISRSDCETASQSTPFIITLQPTVTQQLEGLNFWCVVYDSATSMKINTSSVTVDVIRGKPIVNYLLWSMYIVNTSN